MCRVCSCLHRRVHHETHIAEPLLPLLLLLLLQIPGVFVTCTTDNSSGFESGTYDITLAAYLLEQGPVSVCQQELDSPPATTRITVKPQPVVGLRQLEPKPVCLGAKTAVAKFEYWVDNAGSTVQASAVQPLGEIVAEGSLPLATDCTSEIEGGPLFLSTASVHDLQHIDSSSSIPCCRLVRVPASISRAAHHHVVLC
jgi:hypothetical protein